MHSIEILDGAYVSARKETTTVQAMSRLSAFLLAFPLVSVADFSDEAIGNQATTFLSDRTVVTSSDIEVSQEDLDGVLATELVALADKLLLSQVELSSEAKEVLYSRMSELYRR